MRTVAHTFALAGLALLWASGALAQAAPPGGNGWYLGGGIRPAKVFAEDADIGYRQFGGYRFTRHWGVEMGYSDLGRGTGGTEPGRPAPQKFGYQTTNAWTLAGTGSMAIGESFSLQGRLGLSLATPEAAHYPYGGASGIGLPRYRPSVLWGVGGQYDLTGQFGLRVDYNSFGRLGDDPGGMRSDLWSINAVVRF